MTTNPNPDRAHRAVLTVTVETRPDGTYYVDQADLTRHVSGWLEEALYDRDDVEQVKVGERDAELLRAQAEAHQYRTALQGVARKAAVSVVPPATNQTAEEHRLALSEALGLGTGAPWDAIHDRVTELGLPPLDRDPVARRLGLLAAYRAAVLTEAADLVAALDRRKTVIAADTIKDAWEEGRDEGADLLRRLAAEAPHTETPDGALSPRCDHCQRPGHSFEDCPDADAPAVVAQPGKETTPCSTPNACDPDDGPCERHEREQSHAENDHSLCRRAECEVLRQS